MSCCKIKLGSHFLFLLLTSRRLIMLFMGVFIFRSFLYVLLILLLMILLTIFIIAFLGLAFISFHILLYLFQALPLNQLDSGIIVKLINTLGLFFSTWLGLIWRRLILNNTVTFFQISFYLLCVVQELLSF